MQSTILYYLLVSSVMQWTVPTEATEAKEPSSVNILQGLKATFNCTAYSLGSHWLVNERLPEHSSNSPHRGLTKSDRVIDSDSNLKEHLLYIPAETYNDGVSVQCFIYNLQSIPSTKVYLHIQGILSTVSEVQSFQVNSTTVQISYTPPPTLEDVPISNYSLETSDNQLYWTIDNTTLLTLTDHCMPHIVTIAGWNGLGKGDSINHTLNLYEVPFDSSFLSNNISLLFAGSDHVSVIALSQISNTACIGRVPTILTVVLTAEETELPSTLTCSLAVDNSSCHEVNVSASTVNEEITWKIAINLSSHVQLNKHYQLLLSFGNSAGNTTETTRSFSTHETQSVEYEINKDILCLNCFFGQGSTALGCYGVFVDINGTHANQTMMVLRTTVGPNTDFGRDCDKLLSGVYHLFVYDWNSNGHIESEGVAVTKQAVVPELDTIAISSTSTATIIASTSDTTSITSNTMRSTIITSTTYTAVTPISSITSRPTPPVNQQGGGDTLDTSVLLIVSFVVGSVLTLTLLTVILLMYCLVKTKKKNKRLKIAEIVASERQRHVEVLLNTLTVNRQYTPPNHLHSPHPLSLPPDPMYDNIEEVQSRIHATNKRALPELQDCPAYALPPTISRSNRL